MTKSEVAYYVIRGYRVDVYPVGWLEAWQHRKMGKKLRYALRYMMGQARSRNWRAVKNMFNGYLAEVDPSPPGVTRCGHGWTRRRALRDIRRVMDEAGY